MTSEIPQTLDGTFTEFSREARSKLLRAFTGRYGVERAQEATAEALAWGWENWDKLKRMDNPVGYLYRVGASRTRNMFPRHVTLPPVDTSERPWVEPGLPKALSRLSEKQRTAVLLIHSFGWRYAEASEVMGVGISTVQKHVERALAKLRDSLEVTVDD